MRELKFRVWCKRTQDYHTPIDEEDDDADGDGPWLQMCIDTNGRLYFIETSNEDADYEYVTHDCEIIENQNDNFIIEQYTGLKDRLGEEIYEGDIVKFNETICTVQFNEEYAKYTLRDQSDGVILGFDALIITPFEIIGNIHENPELLEEEE